MPELAPPQSLEEALASATGLLLVPYEGETALRQARGRLLGLRAALRAAAGQQEVSVFVGPEGGFAAEEVERARAAGAQVVSLGRRILRSETAGIAVVAPSCTSPASWADNSPNLFIFR